MKEVSEEYVLSDEGTIIEYHLIVKTMKSNDDIAFYSEAKRDKAFKKALEEKHLLLAHRYKTDTGKLP